MAMPYVTILLFAALTGVAAAAQPNCNALFVAGSTPISVPITRTPPQCLSPPAWLSGSTVWATAPASVVVQGSTWTFQSWSNGGTSLTTTLVLAAGVNVVAATYQQQGASPSLVVASQNPPAGVPIAVSPPDSAGRVSGSTPTAFQYAQPTSVLVSVPPAMAGAPFRRWLVNGVPGGTSPTIGVLASPTALTTLTAEYTQLVAGSLAPFGIGCRGSNGRDLTQSASGNPIIHGTLAYVLSDALPATATVLMVGVSNQRLFQLPLPFEATPLGAPGCWLYCDHVVMLLGRSDGGGSQVAHAAVPGEPSLIGSRLFTQFFAVDVAANRAGLTSSNAIETRFGGYQ